MHIGGSAGGSVIINENAIRIIPFFIYIFLS